MPGKVRSIEFCAACVFALLLTCLARVSWAAPEDDYRAGSQALRAGDVIQAMALLRKAADLGHSASQAMLAGLLDQAEFDEEAIAYYRKSAEQGDPQGEFGLGSMYAAGEGVKRDPIEARKWITRAAEKGHANAISVLAMAYIKGELGIEESQRKSAEALRWVRKASDAGSVPAMEQMALALRTGEYGLSIDLKQAEALELKLRGARSAAAKGAAAKAAARRQEKK